MTGNVGLHMHWLKMPEEGNKHGEGEWLPGLPIIQNLVWFYYIKGQTMISYVLKLISQLVHMEGLKHIYV